MQDRGLGDNYSVLLCSMLTVSAKRPWRLEKIGNFTPANPRASGTIVGCHDIFGAFGWVKGWELGPFVIIFLFWQVQTSKVGLGKLWVRAIGVSSQWDGCEWEWGEELLNVCFSVV